MMLGASGKIGQGNFIAASRFDFGMLNSGSKSMRCQPFCDGIWMNKGRYTRSGGALNTRCILGYNSFQPTFFLVLTERLFLFIIRTDHPDLVGLSI